MLFSRRLTISRKIGSKPVRFKRHLSRRSRRDTAFIPGPICCGPTVEELEGRQMLSAAVSATAAGIAVPTLINLGRVAAPGSVKPTNSPDNASAPYTPSQVQTAYGVNLISFNGIVGNGAGQTIAIVDAYNDPNIVTDTATFNTRFGLPQFNSGGPTFQVLNENGGTTLPMNTNTTVGDWDLEESLDVQWVHSMAPEANVILFESTTANDPDMDQAEVTAAGWPGVSVISNSWGEGEFSGENTEDQYFQTPTGHQGVTFLASAGDSGSPAGYPAYSPYVVSVGGTNLQIQSSGAYISESVWNNNNGWATGGGISTQEALPYYQDNLNGINGASTTNRNVPDVSADADPDSGVYVYDTWNEGQGGGYFQVGGTSLASPLWAGMIGIVNQGRTLAGESTLNGYTQTLPMLYSLPSSDFHDVTTGSNGTYSAAPGYDLVTGLGTPVANLLVPALAGYGTTAPSVSAPTGVVNATWNTANAYSATALPVSVTDAFSAGNPDSYTLSVSHGTIALNSLTGLTVTAGTNGSSTVTVSGTVASLDADLSNFGLTYQPTTNYIGSDSLVVSATDPGESLTGTATVSINVAATAPQVVATPTVNDTENSNLQFTNSITVNDLGSAEQLTASVSHGTLSMSNTTGLTVSGSGTATLTLTGSLSNLNSDLFYLTYSPTTNYTGPDTLNLSDKDTISNLTGTGSIAINVLPLAPSFSLLSTHATIPENTDLPPAVDAPSYSLSDVGGTAENLTVSVSHGTIDFTNTTGLTVTGNNTASVNLVGSLTNINNALFNLYYYPTTNYVGTDTLNFADKDTTDSLNASASMSITITGFSVTAPASASVSENTPLTFSSANGNQVSVVDNYPGNTSDSLQISVANGTLTLGSTTGLTFTAGANGSSSFTVDGAIGNLNAALNGVTYQPNANYTGSDSLAVLLTDDLTTLSTSTNVALTVNAVGAPAFTAPSTAAVAENGSLVFSTGNGNLISLADNGLGFGADSVTMAVSHGTLTLGTTNGLVFSSGSDDSAAFTVKGTVANLNAALVGTTYQPTTNYAGSDTLALSVSDPTDNKTGSASVAITVSPLAPSITAPATASVNENGSLAFSTGNGNAISLTDANPGSDSLTLAVAHGTLTLSTTTGLTFTSGSNASATFTVSGTVGNLNAALNGLTYQPTAAYTGSDTLAISLQDPGDGQSASKNVSLSINSLPAPTITAPATASVLVNNSLIFSSSAISVADSAAGSSSDTLTLSVAHGTITLSTISGLTFTAGSNGSASFTVTGAVTSLNAALNNLTYTPTTSYTGSDSLAISLLDPGDSESASKSVAITVNANSPPTVSAPGSATVPENGSLVFSSGNSNPISVADAGPGSGSDSLQLTVSHGTVTLSTISGLTITAGANGSSTVTVTGSITNLNAALAGLTYKPTSNYTGADSLAVAINDSADHLSGSASVSINVSGSAPPSISAPTSVRSTVGGTTTFSAAKGDAISIADGSAGSSTEELTIKATSGILQLASTTGITFISGANGSASMTIEGTLANLNLALNGMTYTLQAKAATITLAYTDLATNQSVTANITVSSSTILQAGAPAGPASSSVPSANSLSTSTLPPDSETQLAGFAAAMQVLAG
jgi:subtilase family serine protease